MTTVATWKELALRIEAATGPAASIDDAIWWKINLASSVYREVNGERQSDVTMGRFIPDWRPLSPYNVASELTRSLDKIVSLIERKLPGWAWKVGTCSVSDDAWLVPDFNCPTHGARFREQFGPFESGSIWDTGIDIDRRPPGNVALALCQAFCEAMATEALFSASDMASRHQEAKEKDAGE